MMYLEMNTVVRRRAADKFGEIPKISKWLIDMEGNGAKTI